jgi:hypothetical protein
MSNDGNGKQTRKDVKNRSLNEELMGSHWQTKGFFRIYTWKIGSLSHVSAKHDEGIV